MKRTLNPRRVSSKKNIFKPAKKTFPKSFFYLLQDKIKQVSFYSKLESYQTLIAAFLLQAIHIFYIYNQPIFLTRYWHGATGVLILTQIIILSESYWGPYYSQFYYLSWYCTRVYTFIGYPCYTYVLLGSEKWSALFFVLIVILFGSMLNNFFHFFAISFLGGLLILLSCYFTSIVAASEVWRDLVFIYLLVTVVTLVLIQKNERELVNKKSLLQRIGRRINNLVSNTLSIGVSHASIIESALNGFHMSKDQTGQRIKLEGESHIYDQLVRSVQEIKKTTQISQKEFKSFILPLRQKLQNTPWERLDAVECVREAISTFDEREGDIIAFEVEARENFIFWGSSFHIQEVLLVLFDNIRHFSGPEHSANIIIEQGNIIVSNPGKQIPYLHIPYLFESGYTTKNSLAGLGLSYAYRAIQKMEGSISYRFALHNKKNYNSFIISFPQEMK